MSVTDKPAGRKQAWLTVSSGSGASARQLLRGTVIGIGRTHSNQVVVDALTVSSQHCEIRRTGDTYEIRDLGSTNGTFVNGERIEQSPLDADAEIRLGKAGPVLGFQFEVIPDVVFDKTITLTDDRVRREETKETEEAKSAKSKKTSVTSHDEELISDAVARARQARSAGQSDQTQIIMREMLGVSNARSGKRHKVIIKGLVAALVAVTAMGYWKIDQVRKEKTGLDLQIQRIDGHLSSGELDQQEIDALMEQLDDYQRQAQDIQSGLLFKWGILGEDQLFIQQEVRTLMRDFGAEAYRIPRDFIDEVNRFIERYQTSDRPHVERVMGESRTDLEKMRTIFAEERLPPDLSYMALVESAFLAGSYSRAGAAGPWQFRAATAREYGLTVTQELDERYDVEKSTRAAAVYIRRLILDFGSGSSVMLALAAYNVGPGRVRRAVRRVEDPIKQRNFWYLYRARALPPETRDYVPKIIAAIIIGRNPARFGFADASESTAAVTVP